MNQVTPIRAQAPIRARDYSAAQLDLIKRTVASDCNTQEFDLFAEVCRRVGLDPFRKQIYAVVYDKDKPDKRKMSIITGIDGFRAVAARNGDYRPDENEPEITYDAALKSADINPLGIVKAVVRAFKLAPDGQWHPVVGVAHWDEFAPVSEIWEYDDAKGKKQPTGKFALGKKTNWRTMGRIMIAKTAEAQALRKGWPEDLSGIYAPEEMDRAGTEAVSASEAVEAHREEARLALVGAQNTTPLMFAITEGITFVSNGQVVDRVAEHVRAFERAHDLELWRDQNRAGLQQFWATNKGDALEVKRLIEGRLTELRKGESTILAAG